MQGAEERKFVLGAFLGGCVMRGRVMVAKSFVMLVLATLAGPAIGVGIFVVMNAM